MIIGRLIPARFDETEEGRAKLGLDKSDNELNLLDNPDFETMNPENGLNSDIIDNDVLD